MLSYDIEKLGFFPQRRLPTTVVADANATAVLNGCSRDRGRVDVLILAVGKVSRRTRAVVIAILFRRRGRRPAQNARLTPAFLLQRRSSTGIVVGMITITITITIIGIVVRILRRRRRSDLLLFLLFLGSSQFSQ